MSLLLVVDTEGIVPVRTSRRLHEGCKRAGRSRNCPSDPRSVVLGKRDLIWPGVLGPPGFHAAALILNVSAGRWLPRC
jgi:hypothetical protein